MTDEIEKNAKILIKEIIDFGITNDTMASERLYRFYKSLKTQGTSLEKQFGKSIEQLDNNGIYREKSIAYALIVIGHMFGTDIFYLSDT